MSEISQVEIATLKVRVENLEKQVILKQDFQDMVRPIRDQQLEQEKQLSRLADSMERFAKLSESHGEKIETILDDFHKNLLEAAQQRQFLVWLKNNGPAITVVILLITIVFAAFRFYISLEALPVQSHITTLR